MGGAGGVAHVGLDGEGVDAVGGFEGGGELGGWGGGGVGGVAYDEGGSFFGEVAADCGADS